MSRWVCGPTTFEGRSTAFYQAMEEGAELLFEVFNDYHRDHGSYHTVKGVIKRIERQPIPLGLRTTRSGCRRYDHMQPVMYVRDGDHVEIVEWVLIRGVYDVDSTNVSEVGR